MARLFPLGPAPQLNQILVVAPNDTNILAQSFVDTFWEIDQLIRSFVVNGSGISFSDVCQKVLRSSPSLECKRLGFLKFWDSYEEYLLDIHNDTDILSTINSPSYPDGTPVWPEEYMGNIERDNQGNVISAAAVLLQYPTFENHRIYSKLNVIEPGTALWETGFSNLQIFVDGQYKGLRIYWNNRRNEMAAVDEAQANLKQLIGISILVMIFVGGVLAGRLRNPNSRRKRCGHGIIGSLGVISVLFATVAGFGICSFFGFTSSLLNLALPPLLLGIGVDDMFVILSDFEDTDPNLDEAQRLANTCVDIGPSITFTTMSDLLAFGLGMLSTVPAVVSFSFYATVCIFLDFIFQVTFFVAVIVVVNRIEQQGYRVYFYKSCCMPFSKLCRRKPECHYNDARNFDQPDTEDVTPQDSADSLSTQAHCHFDEEMANCSELSLPSFGLEEFDRRQSIQNATLSRNGNSRGQINVATPESIIDDLWNQEMNGSTSTYARHLLENCIKLLSKTLLSKMGQVCAVFAIIGYWAFMGYAATKLEDSLGRTLFFPDGSVAKSFARNTLKYNLRSDLGGVNKVNIVFKHMNFSVVQTQQNILSFQNQLHEYKEYFNGEFDSIFSHLQSEQLLLSQEINGTRVPSNLFHPIILEHSPSNTDTYRFFDDIRLNDEQFDSTDDITDAAFRQLLLDFDSSCEKDNKMFCGGLVSTSEVQQSLGNAINHSIFDGNYLEITGIRIQIPFTNLHSTDQIRKAKALVDQIIPLFFPQVEQTPYAVDDAGSFIIIDVLNGLFKTIFASFGYGLICIGVLTFLFLGSYKSIGLIICCLFIVDVCVFSIPFLLGMKANISSFLMLLISFGLIVDFFVHFLSAYKRISRELPPSVPNRTVVVAEMTMVKVGLPMLLLSLTSVFSAIPLMLSTTELGRVMAFVYVMIVFTGLFHGFIALPVIICSVSSLAKWFKSKCKYKIEEQQ
eukprot:CAMPEP_0117870420 /NCGR_PEP_ID=MMETSP0950-20121206/9831_1 /TAXON_ID=44440 /ORGANISM="Chattonella subsalsa, Strain CCMP2191" /LENGTH=960 /DNA_ID=CAMNT_0005722707 /DNA_START=354 /DNA_END=3236 /DNA_ORIENTATION=+